MLITAEKTKEKGGIKMFTFEEELEYVSIEELVEESVELITLVVKELFYGIAAKAGIQNPPKVRIHKTFEEVPTAFYSAGLGLITLNAIQLQNKDVEYIAFSLAHELYHHKQYEDGERFEYYVNPEKDKAIYASQRVEQEANDFAASLFPNVKYK